MKNDLNVYLVNPITNVGHLDSYCRLYTRAFLDLNCSVTLLSPNDCGTINLSKSSNQSPTKFRFVPIDCSYEDSYYWKLRKFRKKLKKKYIRNNTCKILFSALLNFPIKFLEVLLNTECNHDKKNWFHFSPIYPVISKLIRSDNKKQSLIFILYNDSLNNSSTNLKAFKKLKHIPWAGILFITRNSEKLKNSGAEPYFYLDNCRGALFLTQNSISNYSNLLPDHFFYLAPDITETNTLNNISTSHAIIKIREIKLKYPKIILLIGSLTPHKCLVEFIKTAKISRFSDVFFIALGTLKKELFNHKDLQEISKACDGAYSNLEIIDTYISSEDEYNSIFNEASVIFAMYKNFQGSSNTLTKAAHLKIPVLSSNNSYAGEQVKKNKIGLCANIDEIDNIYKTLSKILSTKINEFSFQHYSEQHSYENLKNTLKLACQHWVN